MKPMRVLVADDNALARQAVLSLLAGAPEFHVVGVAVDGMEAVRKVQELAPNLVLMDINMPGCDGLLATRLIRREHPQVTVVVLTVSDDPGDLFAAIKSGAQGYLLKSLPPDDWLQYLRAVIQGEADIPREVARRILAEFTATPPAVEQTELRLTEREREVLDQVAGAMTNKQVAAALHISEQTVKNHVKNIMHKLQMKSRVELALYAQRQERQRRPPPT